MNARPQHVDGKDIIVGAEKPDDPRQAALTNDGKPSGTEHPAIRIEAFRNVVVAAVIILTAGALLMSAAPDTFRYKVGSLIFAISASAAAGALIGFLFGIPRALTVKADADSSGFTDNTNLEQISDWLTKIIVGVSLVQARDLADGFSEISRLAAAGWGWDGGAVFAGCILLASALVGFLTSYIWTRTDFALFLENNQSNISALKRAREMAVMERDEAQQRALEATSTLQQTEQERDQAQERAQVAASELKETVGFLSKAGPAKTPDEVPPATTEAASAAEASWRWTWNSDPHKGAFGGNAVVDGYQLKAEVTRLAEGGSFYGVRLVVSPLPESPPLTGPVRFYLHPTFDADEHDVVPVDGIAELKIVALEAFTVGAQTSEGVRLELDLNDVPGVPEGFKA
jgi:hypothetical protein